jgi:hypothetical protein
MIECDTESTLTAVTESEVPGVPRGAYPTYGRRNIGTDLDRLVELLPAGAAREFVRGLPRRADKWELLSNLEALVRLLQSRECL